MLSSGLFTDTLDESPRLLIALHGLVVVVVVERAKAEGGGGGGKSKNPQSPEVIRSSETSSVHGGWKRRNQRRIFSKGFPFTGFSLWGLLLELN